MLFIKLTALALLAGTSIALPSLEVNARDDVASIEARTIPSTFYQHAVKAIKAHGPGAFQVSKAKKLQIVETTILKALNADKSGEYTSTLKKYCIKKEDFCGGDDSKEADWIAAWDAISKAWAEYAETETTLATNKQGPDTNSFYKRIEEKILEKKHVKIHVDDEN